MPTIDDYRKEAAAARPNLRTEHERTGCPQCAATTDEIIAWLEQPEGETEEDADASLMSAEAPSERSTERRDI